MIRLSCPDFAFPLLTHDKTMTLVRLLGFTAMDVGLMEGRGHLRPSGELARPDVSGARLRGMLDGHGLTASDVFYQAGGDFKAVALNSADAEVRRRLGSAFERTVAFALAAGCRHITILPGFPFEDADSFARCVETLAARVGKASEAGLKVGVEAHLGSIVPTPEDALRLLEAVPGLTLTLDCSHFERQGVAWERIAPLVPFASHVHARGANAGELQCPMDANTTDFETLLTALDEAGYDGFVDTEYTYSPWQNSDRTDNVSEIVKLREQLRALWFVQD